MKVVMNLLEQLKIGNKEEKVWLLEGYMDRILERNRSVNLTAIRDREAFIEKHYLDSLAAAGLPEVREADRLMDLGTGGGFPGVPLAICFPEKEFVLVDSLNKRIRIIREFCQDLGIRNVTAIHGRAEDLGRQAGLRDGFDCCLSRAVADLRILSEYCLPFVKAGGVFVAYKGEGCEEEMAAARRAIKLLGGTVDRIASATELLGGEVDQIASAAAPLGDAVDQIVSAAAPLGDAVDQIASAAAPLGDAVDQIASAAAPLEAAKDRALPAEELLTGTSHGSEISSHCLLIIRKVMDTPAAYPRKAGVPAKKIL